MNEEFWQAVRGRAVKPVVADTLNISDREKLDPKELLSDEKLPTWGPSFGPIAGFACVIAYQDSRGPQTQRLITCQRKDSHGSEIYIWAYCHTREQVRQFKFSRIEEVFDARTGEALGYPEDIFMHVQRRSQTGLQTGLGIERLPESRPYSSPECFGFHRPMRSGLSRS